MESPILFTLLMVFLYFHLGKGLHTFEKNSYQYRLDENNKSCPDGYYFNETIKTCVSTNITNCTNLEVAKCPITTAVDEYCMCKNMYIQIWNCPEGTYFDANRLICRIGTVECQEEYEPFACPNETSTDVFCLCIDGEFHSNNCPNGYTFNTEQKLCLKSGSELPDSEPSSEKCQRYGLFGDPTDCTGYYHCREKGSEIQYSRCSGGTIFSLTSFGCVTGSC
uniref:Peritrophin-44 n=1 Tax=Drosophila rhopaloa TaxID=1041015 RepID=A0A6P4EXY9_DRORH